MKIHKSIRLHHHKTLSVQCMILKLYYFHIQDLCRQIDHNYRQELQGIHLADHYYTLLLCSVPKSILMHTHYRYKL